MWNNSKAKIDFNFTFVLMKSVISLLTMMLVGAFSLVAQQNSDTIPYKIATYDIKKQQSVVVVANKLKVDPKIIVRLNKLRSIQQDLVEGQRIKIPVYPKGYVYEAEKDFYPSMPKLDSAQAKLIYEDTVKARPAPVQEIVMPVLPTIDKDEAEARLMMIDAITELNEAMLQGVRASIDTLNAEKEYKVDEKNIQLMLIKMKRARDKVLLMPYLEHIQDSLTKEVKLMQEEKEFILNLLNPTPLAAAPIVTKDTVVAGSDMVVYQTTVFPESGKEEKVIERVISTEPITAMLDEPVVEQKKVESKRKKERYVSAPVDTVIVYDLALDLKPAPEKNPIPSPTRFKGSLWDTARAVDPIKDSLTLVKVEQMRKDTTFGMLINIPNTLDKVVIKPITKTPQKRTDTIEAQVVVKRPIITTVLPKDTGHIVLNGSITHADTVYKQNVTSLSPTNDTAAKEIDVVKYTVTPTVSADKQTADTVKMDSALAVSPLPMSIEPKKPTLSVGEAALANADSIRFIKAQFFYKRAVKASAEKNYRNADQYLKKAIELSPNYYDAWFARAEMDDMFGSQAIALKEYKQCYQIDSTKPKLHYNMGNLLAKMKRKSDAYNAYNKAIELDKKYVAAYMARGTILMDWKQYGAAIEDYNQVLQINRAYHFAYKARGQARLANREYATAIDDFTRFLIFEEFDPSAYYYRGIAKIGSNELLDGCLDLSTASEMGYIAAEKAIKKSCQ